MKIKKLLLLIILSIIILPTIKAKATTSFYEAEYIPNIYINRKINGMIYYQQARYMRETNTNKAAYCLEPFTDMHSYHEYYETISPRNLSQEQMDKIKKAVFLGYNPNSERNSNIWYVITQVKIWQIANPNGSYYFVDSLNGNPINTYDYLLNELENDIKNFSITPSFTNRTFDVIEKYPTMIKDHNNVIQNYTCTDSSIKINNDCIIISNLLEGSHTLTFENKNYPKGDVPILFYQSQTSQNIITVGNINPNIVTVNINVKKTGIKIVKLDYDTNTKTPAPNTSLDGAVYELTTASNTKVANLTIKNNQASIEALPHGKYYLKEIKAGNGYTLDPTIYEITISDNEPIKELVLTNEVIKAIVEINKEYLVNDTFKNEANVEFTIYDSDNNIIEEITTDNNGHAEVQLAYGTYLIEQTSTTPGYNYIESFTIEIKDNTTLTYNLKNYEIEIPKTSVSTKKNYSWINILYILILFIIKSTK